MSARICNCAGCDVCGTHCVPGCASGDGEACTAPASPDEGTPLPDPRGKDHLFWIEEGHPDPDGYAFSPDCIALMEHVRDRLFHPRTLNYDERCGLAEKLRLALEDRVPFTLNDIEES
jgi:hypothetical protein